MIPVGNLLTISSYKQLEPEPTTDLISYLLFAFMAIQLHCNKKMKRLLNKAILKYPAADLDEMMKYLIRITL